MTQTGRLSRLHQISMRAHDIDRAVRFYRDALGLPFLFAAPPRLAFFDCAGVRLMLSTPEPNFDHPGSVLYFAALRDLAGGSEESIDIEEHATIASALEQVTRHEPQAHLGEIAQRGSQHAGDNTQHA